MIQTDSLYLGVGVRGERGPWRRPVRSLRDGAAVARPHAGPGGTSGFVMQSAPPRGAGWAAAGEQSRRARGRRERRLQPLGRVLSRPGYLPKQGGRGRGEGFQGWRWLPGLQGTHLLQIWASLAALSPGTQTRGFQPFPAFPSPAHGSLRFSSSPRRSTPWTPDGFRDPPPHPPARFSLQFFPSSPSCFGVKPAPPQKWP